MDRALYILTLALAGCAGAPLSYLDGQPFTRVDPMLYPVKIMQIDAQLVAREKLVPVDPGVRRIVVAAPPAEHSHVLAERVLMLKVEPCVRYVLGARRSSPLIQNFEPVVVETLPVDGCDPAKAGVVSLSLGSGGLS